MTAWKGQGNGMGDAPGHDKADVLHVVEQAIRIRMVWEEVSSTHWAGPFDEALEALTAAAHRWGVPLDSSFARRAALGIHAGSWE
ncbi:hypothetical protein ACIRP2_39225 [Streptomyces sp. NPDC101194]|uniref:hypothetical protein n=1 Tax=Streptomyces sp. NPDC101194 TaxID=3366127 RepID=UPI003809D022